MAGHHKWSDIKEKRAARAESQKANRESVARQLGGGDVTEGSGHAIEPLTLPAETEPATKSGPIQAEGYTSAPAEDGTDAWVATPDEPAAKPKSKSKPVKSEPAKPTRAAKVYQPSIHLKAALTTTPDHAGTDPACGMPGTVTVTNVKKVTCGRCKKTALYKTKLTAANLRDAKKKSG